MNLSILIFIVFNYNIYTWILEWIIAKECQEFIILI